MNKSLHEALGTNYMTNLDEDNKMPRHIKILRAVQKQHQELLQLRSEHLTDKSTIEYDKGRIKSLMHENDMVKRRNKENEERLTFLDEKINEHLATIYKYEIDIERLQLRIDKHDSQTEGLQKEKDFYKISSDKYKAEYKTIEERLNKFVQEYEEVKSQITEKEK